MISLAEIAKALDCDFCGNGNLIFSSPAEPLIAKKDQIAIAIDKKFENQLFETKAKGAIISSLFDWKTTNLEGVVIAKKTKITLSKLKSFIAWREKCTCPKCGGSNEPPNRPIFLPSKNIE